LCTTYELDNHLRPCLHYDISSNLNTVCPVLLLVRMCDTVYLKVVYCLYTLHIQYTVYVQYTRRIQSNNIPTKGSQGHFDPRRLQTSLLNTVVLRASTIAPNNRALQQMSDPKHYAVLITSYHGTTTLPCELEP
jgi:hypothetical protein